MSVEKKQILFIVGPTGIGKSAVGIALAKKIDGEIVSADSMQMYQGMNIGTAKVTPEEQQGVVHHLLDIVDVATPMDVAMYRKEAMAVIDSVLNRGKIPIVVGGSGLYVRSLTDGLFEGPTCNPDLRRKLNALADEKGNQVLVETLEKMDPEIVKKISLNDRRRLIRAIEVFEAEKKPFSELKNSWSHETKQMEGTPFQLFGLNRDRASLYQKINERVDEMFEQGLVAETEALLKQGLQKNRVALQAIGYKEVVAYLEGKIDLEACQEWIKKGSRQFAKRQLTWFGRDPRVNWIDLSGQESVEEIAEILYNKLKGI